MRFSSTFGVQTATDDDWFDPVLTEDTPLYVDPFLVFDDDDPFWSESHEVVLRFFDTALNLVRQANGNRNSAHWRKAERLLLFPEPFEFALGLSMGPPLGSGTGAEFGERMCEALALIASRNITQVDYVDLFTLFVKGLGVDRISDILCNILKSKFIQYTQTVVARHGVATDKVRVKHARWSPNSARWDDLTLDLPRSWVTGGGVLLVPDRFLKDIPTVTTTGFWGWAETNIAEVLRDDLNYDLATSLTKAEKDEYARKLAWKRPDAALNYIADVATRDHAPYDVAKDPKLLVGWHEAGREAFDPEGTLPQPATPEEFCDWVGTLVERFKHAVEQTDLWRALWDDGLAVPRKEKIVQAVAGQLMAAHCEAANVDVSREANIGRGPVDFKFSAGWTKRALAEVKLISSSHFNHGAQKQLPQYLVSEQIECGYYVCVGFRDADFSDARLKLVEETCTALSKAKGVSMKPIYIDARPKASASKL